MKADLRVALLAFALLLLGGCYRTTYLHFQPEPIAETQPPEAPVRKTGWQHFFVWGWFPEEHQIDAVETCGGAEGIHSIETQRTFVEGLVAAVAGYYVNVYSPWNGAVYCTKSPAE